MLNLSPDTDIRLTITKFIIIIGSLIGFGFVGGSAYTKVTFYEQKMDNINIRLVKIEKLLENSHQYYGYNKP